MKNIYAVLGKECGHTHYFEVELDMIHSFYNLRQGGQPIVKFNEVELKGSDGRKVDQIIFDEHTPKEPKEKTDAPRKK